ncbi:MAG TPA: S-layer protein, partial [Verrucomicrobiales bacterium]|nr:S-layer protein [Verrucomicrobiales bacterium]
RVFLDTIGRLPTPGEAREFIADPSPEKYPRLVDRLLGRPEYVDYWAYKWSDLLLVTGAKLRPEPLKAYYGWIRARVATNAPWDLLVRELITARGSSTEEGASNFFAVHQDPEAMAENVSQAFLGLSINCARCHNHPLEKWTNDQYYQFANLFARVRAKGWGGDARSGDGQRTLYVEPRGDLIQPRTGRPQPPAPLDAPPLPPDDPGDRREALAAWLTSPSNPYFTRAIVNRVWAHFLGIGLVEPVDDLRVSNPASNEPLLAGLAAHLVGNHYDLKSLMRLILNSETYRRSGDPLPGNREDHRQYSHHYPRRLPAEVLSDAIADVTGVPDSFKELALNDGSSEATAAYKEGTRALELADASVKSYFLKTFGRNQREITCECERSNQPSLVQVLHLSNGPTINEKLASKEGRLSRLLAANPPFPDLMREAWLLCLSREPTVEEQTRLESLMGGVPAGDRRQAAEDLLWSLLTSREFLFQH